MYEHFFKLTRTPFRTQSEPELFFEGKSHRNTISCLEQAMSAKKAVITLFGLQGTGKTTLVQKVVSKLISPNTFVYRISKSEDADIEHLIVEELSHRLGQSAPAGGPTREASALHKMMKTTSRDYLLIIDEAQRLSIDEIDFIHDFVALGEHSDTVLKVVLVGHAEARNLVGFDDVSGNADLQVTHCSLEPLDKDEISQYVELRLRNSGWNGDPELSESVYTCCFEITCGVPRRINSFFDRLFQHMAFEGLHAMDQARIDTFLTELHGELSNDANLTFDDGEILKRIPESENRKTEPPKADPQPNVVEAIGSLLQKQKQMQKDQVKEASITELQAPAEQVAEPLEVKSVEAKSAEHVAKSHEAKTVETKSADIKKEEVPAKTESSSGESEDDDIREGLSDIESRLQQLNREINEGSFGKQAYKGKLLEASGPISPEQTVNKSTPKIEPQPVVETAIKTPEIKPEIQQKVVSDAKKEAVKNTKQEMQPEQKSEAKPRVEKKQPDLPKAEKHASGKIASIEVRKAAKIRPPVSEQKPKVIDDSVDGQELVPVVPLATEQAPAPSQGFSGMTVMAAGIAVALIFVGFIAINSDKAEAPARVVSSVDRFDVESTTPADESTEVAAFEVHKDVIPTPIAEKQSADETTTTAETPLPVVTEQKIAEEVKPIEPEKLVKVEEKKPEEKKSDERKPVIVQAPAAKEKPAPVVVVEKKAKEEPKVTNIALVNNKLVEVKKSQEASKPVEKAVSKPQESAPVKAVAVKTIEEPKPVKVAMVSKSPANTSVETPPAKPVIPKMEAVTTPKAEKKIADVSVEELDHMMTRFKWYYESGDSHMISSLFTEDARTNDNIAGRKAITDGFKELFAATDYRVFSYKDISWKTTGLMAVGSGAFKLTVIIKETGESNDVEGRIYVRVLKSDIDDKPEIKGLYYQYDLASNR
ncbi:MAG: AAA family ATPase [Gammaproteobacteria bacterium]|nr:AAA family ATPase [Gammaproteobacteria bacterium]